MCPNHELELPTDSKQGAVIPAAELQALKDGETITFTRNGRPVAQLMPIDPDQAWFWTPEWQAKEHEVDKEVAAGEKGKFFDTGEEFLANLKKRMKPSRDQ